MHKKSSAASAAPRAPRLAERVMEDLSRLMADDVLRPGQKLPTEAELMGRMGVSRTVIREALSRLQAAGLVETRHGVGTFVASLHPRPGLGLGSAAQVTLREVIALLEFRVSLETEAAALAAVRRTAVHMDAMRAAVRDFALRLEEGGKAVQPDTEFHRQIMLATGNPFFVEVFASLGTGTVPRTRINTALLVEPGGEPGAEQAAGASPEKGAQHYLERTNHEHEDICNAIERGDPEAARAAMRTHLVNSIQRLKRVSAQSEKQ